MQVFNLYLKIIKKNIPTMLIYVIVFLIVSLIISSSMSKEQQEVSLFVQRKTNMAFISEEESLLIDGLKEELEKIANFIDLPGEKEALQDALYFRTVSYILQVPKGFTESFMKGEYVELEKMTIPDSTSNIYIDISIENYFNTAKLYIQQIENISQESLVQQLKKDFSVGASVELKTQGNRQGDTVYSHYFFNYMAYSLLSILILGMSTIMLIFYKDDLRKRNLCSPISVNSINLQFILANLLFTVFAWLIMVIFCLLYNLENSFNLNTVYFILNSLIFAFCGASISFLVGNLVKNANTIPAVSTVATLGLCFISGVFVPTELLGSTVLKIANFTPTYWYVNANNKIAKMTLFSFSNMQPVFFSMLIQLLFTLAFFTIALVISKKKSA
jgi:ABC-2 type transport system permease protein